MIELLFGSLAEPIDCLRQKEDILFLSFHLKNSRVANVDSPLDGSVYECIFHIDLDPLLVEDRSHRKYLVRHRVAQYMWENVWKWTPGISKNIFRQQPHLLALDVTFSVKLDI